MLANCRSQFLLNRIGRCLKLFVSTENISSHEFASQFGLDIFLYAKNTQNYREYRVAYATVYLNEAPTAGNRPLFVSHGRSIAIDNVHERRQQRLYQIEPKQGKARKQEFIHSRLDKCSSGIMTLPMRLIVCVKINNEEVFFNVFPVVNSYYFICG